MLTKTQAPRRAEFEAWWGKKYKPNNSLHPASTCRFESERDGPVGAYMMLATDEAWEAWQVSAGIEREACAQICDARARICAEKAEMADDEGDRTDMKAMAWQFSALAAEIRGIL